VVTKLYNFRLEDSVIGLLDRIATVLGITRSRALRQSVAAAGAILQAAQQQSIARLVALRERYGDDAKLIVSVVMRAVDENPLAALTIDGEVPDDVRAVPIVAEGTGTVLVFLNVVLGEGEFSEMVLASFGEEQVLIPDLRLPLAKLPWPPDPTKGIVIRLGDLDQIIEAEPTLRELVEL